MHELHDHRAGLTGLNSLQDSRTHVRLFADGKLLIAVGDIFPADDELLYELRATRCTACFFAGCEVYMVGHNNR